MTETRKKLKIDVVSEVHAIRRKHAEASSDQIEQAAARAREEISKRRKTRQCAQ